MAKAAVRTSKVSHHVKLKVSKTCEFKFQTICSERDLAINNSVQYQLSLPPRVISFKLEYIIIYNKMRHLGENRQIGYT